MEPVLTKLTRLPKELCEYAVLTEFTWLTQENHILVSIELGWITKDFLVLAY